MSSVLSSMALWLADVHILTGLLLAVVLPALLLFRQPARSLAVAKSTLVAIALLSALCMLPGWSVIHLAGAPPEIVPSPASAAPSVTQPIPQQHIEQIPSALSPAPIVLPPEAAGSGGVALEPIKVAVVAQLVGSCTVAAWLLAGAACAQRLRRTAASASRELQLLLAVVSDADAPPRLLVSDRVASPVAIGLARPAIVLPRELASRDESRAEIAPILAHEFAHIAAGDLRTLALSRLLLIIFWPQPLYWLLRRRVRFYQESLADAAAAELAGRLRYAEQLVGWARTASRRIPRIAGAVGLWEGPSQLKLRIALLLDEQLIIVRTASRRWRIGTWCLALIAASFLSLVTIDREQAIAQDSADAASDAVPPAGPRESLAEEDPSAAAPAGVPEWARRTPNVFSGRAVDKDGKPLAGVEVTLYRHTSAADATPQKIATQTTGPDGLYRFEKVLDVAREFPSGLPDERFLQSPLLLIAVIARAPDRASDWGNTTGVYLAKHGNSHQLKLDRAATLTGLVTDIDQRPIAGARVSVSRILSPPGNLIRSAVTDADGRYAITDLAPFDAVEFERERLKLLQNRSGRILTMAASTNAAHFTHANYAARNAALVKVPGTIDVQLSPEALLEGVVKTRDENGVVRPAAGAEVMIVRELPPGPASAEALVEYQTASVRSGADGSYRIGNLPTGKYSIGVKLEGWVTAGMRGVSAVEGSTTAGQDLVLSRGGKVRLRLNDQATGKLAAIPDGSRGVLNLIPDLAVPTLNLIESKASICEAQIPPGSYNFLVYLNGLSEADPEWQSADHSAIQTAPQHEVVEGEVLEVTIPVKKWTAAEAETGYIELAPTGDAADFVPATPPADNDGASTLGPRFTNFS